jgi:hypothetical protein
MKHTAIIIISGTNKKALEKLLDFSLSSFEPKGLKVLTALLDDEMFGGRNGKT